MNLKNTLGLMGFFALIVGGFYWFEIRPIGLRKECFEKARNFVNRVSEAEREMEKNGTKIIKNISFNEVENKSYLDCLREKGTQE